MIARRKRLKRGGYIMRYTPLSRVSKKLQGRLAIYRRRRKAFLIANPWCMIRMAEHGWKAENMVPSDHDLFLRMGIPRSRDVHHVRGRVGVMLLDERYWMAVSRKAHRQIHDNPSWARSNGFLK